MCGATMLRMSASIPPAVVVIGVDPEPRHVERRQEQERQQRADDDAAHHRVGHRAPENLARDRNQRETCGGRRQQDRPHPMLGRFDHGIPGRAPLLPQILDLHDQDHRVSDQNTDQCQHAEERRSADRQQVPLTQAIADSVPVPVIASGGVGTLDDVLWATAYQIALMLKVRVVLLLAENGSVAVKTGYPPEDLILKPGLIERAAAGNASLARRGRTGRVRQERIRIRARSAARGAVQEVPRRAAGRAGRDLGLHL